jgi:LuxR family transcriptional regulator, quorum-sensing system regulator SolR
MMVKIEPAATGHNCPYPIPPFLSPIVDSMKQGDSLFDGVRSIVKELGFESFVYGMSQSRTHRRDERFYVWGTVPSEWLHEYDQKSYIEIDPRVAYGWDVLPPPLIWDATIANGDATVERFLARAAEFGIGSGVAVYLRDDTSKIMVALSSRDRYLSDERRAAICAATGTIMHFSSLFHWLFVKQVVARGIPPAQQGRPLSEREISCLRFAAHGMTSKDIGVKLGIKQRTANFHFANIISKLGVLNRHEAIANALVHGLIDVNDSPCDIRTHQSRNYRRK